MLVQVKKNHYISERYHSIERFILYFEQISAIFKYLDQGTLLEVGVGNKTVTDYLTKFGVDVKTLDFDANLRPDFIADIRNTGLRDSSFDMVTAFEVLEHIPYADFEKALVEMHRVARKYAIISLPVYGFSVDVMFRFFNRATFKETKFLKGGVIPFFGRKFNINKEGFGEHYWEIGTKATPYKKVLMSIKNAGFEIVDRYHPRFEATTCLFVLKKK